MKKVTITFEVSDKKTEVRSKYTGDQNSLDAEYADCFLLLFGSASLAGLNYDDIYWGTN